MSGRGQRRGSGRRRRGRGPDVGAHAEPALGLCASAGASADEHRGEQRLSHSGKTAVAATAAPPPSPGAVQPAGSAARAPSPTGAQLDALEAACAELEASALGMLTDACTMLQDARELQDEFTGNCFRMRALQSAAVALAREMQAHSPRRPAPRREPVLHTIQVADYRFLPRRLQAQVGDVVQWRVRAGEQVQHLVAAADGSFESPLLSAGDRFLHTLTKPGTLVYMDGIFSFMSGSIMVGAPRSAAAVGSSSARPTVATAAPASVAQSPLPPPCPVLEPAAVASPPRSAVDEDDTAVPARAARKQYAHIMRSALVAAPVRPEPRPLMGTFPLRSVAQSLPAAPADGGATGTETAPAVSPAAAVAADSVGSVIATNACIAASASESVAHASPDISAPAASTQAPAEDLASAAGIRSAKRRRGKRGSRARAKSSNEPPAAVDSSVSFRPSDTTPAAAATSTPLASAVQPSLASGTSPPGRDGAIDDEQQCCTPLPAEQAAPQSRPADPCLGHVACTPEQASIASIGCQRPRKRVSEYARQCLGVLEESKSSLPLPPAHRKPHSSSCARRMDRSTARVHSQRCVRCVRCVGAAACPPLSERARSVAVVCVHVGGSHAPGTQCKTQCTCRSNSQPSLQPCARHSCTCCLRWAPPANPISCMYSCSAS